MGTKVQTSLFFQTGDHLLSNALQRRQKKRALGHKERKQLLNGVWGTQWADKLSTADAHAAFLLGAKRTFSSRIHSFILYTCSNLIQHVRTKVYIWDLDRKKTKDKKNTPSEMKW